MQYAWTCQCCGEQFDTLPMNYGADAPHHFLALPEEERAARAKLHSDFCTIDDHHFFVRGCIEIAVEGQEEKFVWGAWVSLSREKFKRALELWQGEVPAGEPPCFGWLSTELPLYPSTLNLRTQVRFRGDNLRPLIELEPSDHPLALEQRRGMTVERVQEIAAALLHRREPNASAASLSVS